MYSLIGQFVACVIVGFLLIGFVVYFLYNGFSVVNEKLKDKQFKEYSKRERVLFIVWDGVLVCFMLSCVAFVGYSFLMAVSTFR